MPLVFIVVAITVEYPRALNNYGPVGGADAACHIHIHRDEIHKETFTACDSKESCNATPLLANFDGAWKKCWGNCVENGFKYEFTLASEGGYVPVHEQITVEYIPYSTTFQVPTLAEAKVSAFGALQEMRPGLAGLHVNITGKFAHIVSLFNETFVKFKTPDGYDSWGSIDGTNCYEENYWWVDSGLDFEWQEFDIYVGEPEYTSSYCYPGPGVPGYAPQLDPDPAINAILRYGTVSDPFTQRIGSPPPPGTLPSQLADKTCRISMAPLPDPVTGKMPAHVQYPMPVHPSIYVLPRPFSGWFIISTQPEWPFRPYGNLIGLFWASFTLFWVYHIFFDYLIWILYACRLSEMPSKYSPWHRELEERGIAGRCWLIVQKIIISPVRDLVDFWLCLETPGLGGNGGITVAQKMTIWGEMCCFTCICRNFECSEWCLCSIFSSCMSPAYKPCCGDKVWCERHFSENGEGNPGEFWCDKLGPTSNARLDYGHDYFRNRAADTFTNVPHRACFGGTAFDFPAENIRAVLLIGPKLIGKRSILRFAAARGFETVDLGEEDAQNPEARWNNALAKFKALREDPSRKDATPVIFGAGGTVWEEYAMPQREVVRMAKEEGVEVVLMLWESDSIGDYDPPKTLTASLASETTLMRGLGAGGGIADGSLVLDTRHIKYRCRPPAALTMHRWAKRLASDVKRSDLDVITNKYANNAPQNPWDYVFGRRLVVDMHPEEALVRILMPYRGRRKGPNILWGGCTKGAPSLKSVDFRKFPDAEGPYDADYEEEKSKKGAPHLLSQIELVKLMGSA